ncbi:accessory gene regulator B family protein [Bacillus cytotoxicus]|uniref:accessory gene regulator B family protein n=1 Tax=Bacillus cereus group sp. BfR-BA-01492 TaxID=2920361 RepID=UPI002412CC9E|nr:accessory gene regulator B family protein [Bacillus cereus group sp. BfR-BA-01492]EMA6343239.1 accessory gene regulator B family protein [Bacillus cytotoxicus]
MENELHKTISITEKVSHRVLHMLIKNEDISRVEYLKCKLAIEVFFLNVSKISLIYLIALCLKILVPVIIFHISFMIIRTYAYGAHAKTSFQCTLLSCFQLVGIPYLIVEGGQVTKLTLITLVILNFLILYKYGPTGTKKNPITNMDKIRNLKMKALKMNLFILVVVVLSSSLLIANLIAIGSFTACVMLLPTTYKLLTGDYV